MGRLRGLVWLWAKRITGAFLIAFAAASILSIIITRELSGVGLAIIAILMLIKYGIRLLRSKESNGGEEEKAG